MPHVRITDTAATWILAQANELCRYALEGIEGEPALLDVVAHDSIVYRYLASSFIFLRSLAGIFREIPMITED